MLPMFSEKKNKRRKCRFSFKNQQAFTNRRKRKNNTMLCFAIIFGRDTKKQEKNVAFLALILPSNTTCRL